MAGPKLKVKKGDTVIVIAGKDKGAKGKVLAAYPDRQRVLVEGVNRVKKHTKISAGQRGAKQGGIVHQRMGVAREIDLLAKLGTERECSNTGEQKRNDKARVNTQDSSIKKYLHGATAEPTGGDQHAADQKEAIDSDRAERLLPSGELNNKFPVVVSPTKADAVGGHHHQGEDKPESIETFKVP